MRPAIFPATPRIVFCAALMAIMLAAPVCAHAAAPTTAAPLDKKARMDAMAAKNPEAAKLVVMAQDLYNSLPKAQAHRLVVVRTGFGMVRAAEMAKDDIAKTVTLCDKTNPSMKKDLDGHFTDFQNKVMPEVATQEKNLQAAINDKGNFSHPDQIKAFLDQLDKVTLYAKAQGEKNMTRVTTPDACAALGQSMDKNGGAIVDALQKIDWPDGNTASGSPDSASPRSTLPSGASSD